MDNKIKNILMSIRYHGKWLVSVYTYGELCKKDSIFFHKLVKNNEIKYLKYLKKDCKIEFYYNNYHNIFKCVKFLVDKNYTNIVIYVKNKEEFNDYIAVNDISDVLSPYVKIRIKADEILLNEYLKYETILYNMIKEAYDLSPLEKYIYAYNVVKNFKEYKENDDNKRSARGLYEILENDYIVCVGFANLLNDLLTKLNINSTTVDTEVDISYDNEKIDEIDFNETKCVQESGHERIYVYLKDDKYNINGYYLSDPTWDNYLEYDLYNHMLFTNRDKDYLKDYEWIDKFMLFDVNSLHEFNRYFDFLKDKLNKSSLELMDYIIDIIVKLDPNYIEGLKKKYKFIDKDFNHIDVGKNINYKKLLCLKKELALYIIDHVNNNIEEKNIWKAIKVIYKKFYGYKGKKKLNKGLKRTRTINDFAKNYTFPNREKIYKDGSKVLIKSKTI